MTKGKLIILVICTLATFSCTKFERFKTREVLPDYMGKDAAQLRVVAGVPEIYANPNLDCLTIEKDKVFAVNRKAPKVKGENYYGPNPFRLFDKQSKPEYKILNGKILSNPAMPPILKEDLQDRTYVIQEYRLKPDYPFTVFIKTREHSDIFSFHNAEDKVGFAGSFIPKKNRSYQLKITEHEERGYIVYRMVLIDITTNTPTYINVSRAYSCNNKN